MIFPTPQWRWRVAYEPVSYGFVDNVVRLYPEQGRETEAYVAVPTEFFQLVSVFDEELRTHAAIVGALFYMDEVDGVWVFGMETKDGKHHVDLWSYTTSTLPKWAEVNIERKRW